MKWYIFLLDQKRPVMDTVIVDRPPEARPADGGPFTPWFDAHEHWDERHIHIMADCDKNAYSKAYGIWNQYYDAKTGKLKVVEDTSSTEFGLSPVTIKEMNGHLQYDVDTSLSIPALSGYHQEDASATKKSELLEALVSVAIIAALVFLYTLTP
jgi:hypothetical protein